MLSILQLMLLAEINKFCFLVAFAMNHPYNQGDNDTNVIVAFNLVKYS